MKHRTLIRVLPLVLLALGLLPGRAGAQGANPRFNTVKITATVDALCVGVAPGAACTTAAGDVHTGSLIAYGGIAIKGGTPSDGGIVIPADTPASTVSNLYSPDGISLYFGALQLATGASVAGTVNRIGKFTGVAAVGDSSISDDGSTVSTAIPIVTTSTSANSLDVGGGINAGSGNVALVGTDGRINGPLSSTIIDDLSAVNLTNIPAGQLTGTVADARLSSNVALLNATQSFTGKQTIALSSSAYAFDMVQSGSTEWGFELRRTGGTASSWAFYIPAGSSDFRWFNGADRMSLSSAGLLTVTNNITAAGTIRATGESAPVSGTGLEFGYDGTQGNVRVYNRTGSVYLPMAINALTLTVNTATNGAITFGSGLATFNGAATFGGDATISGSNKSLFLTNSSGSSISWQIAPYNVGVGNIGFVIRDTTNGVNRMYMDTSATAFTGYITAGTSGSTFVDDFKILGNSTVAATMRLWADVGSNDSDKATISIADNSETLTFGVNTINVMSMLADLSGGEYIAQGLWMNNVVGSSTSPGPYIGVGRNSSGSAAAGTVRYTALTSTISYTWVDTSSLLRIGSAAPAADGSPSDTSGTVVGDQTSLRASKNIYGEFTDYAGALRYIVNAPLFDFDYRDGRYNAQRFVGITTDDSPVFGKDRDAEHPQGRAMNDITLHGYTLAAIKELERRLSVAEAAIGRTLSTLVPPFLRHAIYVPVF